MNVSTSKVKKGERKRAEARNTASLRERNNRFGLLALHWRSLVWDPILARWNGDTAHSDIHNSSLAIKCKPETIQTISNCLICDMRAVGSLVAVIINNVIALCEVYFFFFLTALIYPLAQRCTQVPSGEATSTTAILQDNILYVSWLCFLPLRYVTSGPTWRRAHICNQQIMAKISEVRWSYQLQLGLIHALAFSAKATVQTMYTWMHFLPSSGRNSVFTPRTYSFIYVQYNVSL